MGLFSFLNKNKQEAAAEDSGYYSRPEDDADTARARSKRASSAGEPAARRASGSRQAADPVLPEKKRARRRLVGAVALALAVAVGLPMLLDAEPKPLASDIAIQIPSKDKVAPLPPPSAPVAAAESLDQREEIVDPAKAAPAPAPTAAPAVAEVTVPAARPAPAKAEPARHEPKPEPKPEHKPEHKPEPKLVAKPEPKAEPAHKPAPKAEPKLADKPADKPDSGRALAILEDKADKPKAAEPADASGQKFVVQVAALASQEKVTELQGKLKQAGIASYTQATNSGGERVIRVRIGPFSRDEADKMRARLGKIGLGGSLIPG